jgi:hypothetical protein
MARHQADATEIRHTMLCQNWPTIAQSLSPVTKPYLSEVSLATNSEIERRMEQTVFKSSWLPSELRMADRKLQLPSSGIERI